MLFAISILAASYQEAPRLQLKLGDEWSYRLEQSFIPSDLPGAPEDELLFVYEGKVRVSAKKNEGFDLESSFRLVRQRSGGEELPSVKGTPDQIRSITVSPTGMRTFEPGRYDSPVEFRLSRLLWFGIAPDAQKNWTITWPAINGGWVPPLEANFQLAGKTDRLERTCILYNVRYTEKETSPIYALGRLEVDELSGLPLAAEISSSSVPIPGGEGHFRMKLKLEVTKLNFKSR